MESTSLVLSIVSIANMAVLGVLICIFGKMYGKTKAQLPLGMIGRIGIFLNGSAILS
jgi:hypothetical protein